MQHRPQHLGNATFAGHNPRGCAAAYFNAYALVRGRPPGRLPRGRSRLILHARAGRGRPARTGASAPLFVRLPGNGKSMWQAILPGSFACTVENQGPSAQLVGQDGILRPDAIRPLRVSSPSVARSAIPTARIGCHTNLLILNSRRPQGFGSHETKNQPDPYVNPYSKSPSICGSTS
jgi:hypothetical protein